jgi:hypothetical protein
MMDRMRPMIARALREMEERLRAEKTIPAVERIKPIWIFYIFDKY